MIHRLKRQTTKCGEINTRPRRFNPFRPRQRMRNWCSHIRCRHLRHHRAIGKGHKTVHNRLRVNNRIKLIEFPDAPRCCDLTFIHSVRGFRYITVRVADMRAAVGRATAAGAKPIARGPIEMPAPFKPGVGLAVLRDPDGNLIELIGPK